MDAKLKQKWVKALRSGRYRQYRGMLCSPSRKSLCCIGVGGVVAGVKFDLDTSTFRVADDLGLTPAQQSRLVDLNDTDKWSFKQIADYIEEHL